MNTNGLHRRGTDLYDEMRTHQRKTDLAAAPPQEAAPQAPREAQAVEWPKVWGTSRMHDNSKALLVMFDSTPTDDQLRNFDETIKGRGLARPAAATPSPSGQWVSVPMELTEEMLMAWFKPLAVPGDGSVASLQERYAAMLDASPEGRK